MRWCRGEPRHKRIAQACRETLAPGLAASCALTVEPEVLLLDEPLSALDLKLREHMRKELRAIQKRVGITFIYHRPRPRRGLDHVRPRFCGHSLFGSCSAAVVT